MCEGCVLIWETWCVKLWIWKACHARLSRLIMELGVNFIFARAPKARWELGRRDVPALVAHSLPHLLPVVPAKPFPTEEHEAITTFSSSSSSSSSASSSNSQWIVVVYLLMRNWTWLITFHRALWQLICPTCTRSLMLCCSILLTIADFRTAGTICCRCCFLVSVNRRRLHHQRIEKKHRDRRT